MRADMKGMNAYGHRTLAIAVGVALYAAPPLLRSDTIVGGLITSDTTWYASNTPYIAEQSVFVMGGTKLTIEPGVTVKFHPDTALSVTEGTLCARGTDESNIVFTGFASPPDVESNRWAYIGMSDFAVDASFDASGDYANGCIIEHAVIEFAGGGFFDGGIRAEDSTPLLRGIIVRNCVRRGIYLEGADGIRVEDCVVTNNSSTSGGGGMYIYDCHWSTITNVTVSSNNSGSHGGGMYISSCNNLAITDITASENSSTDSGGGMYIYDCDWSTIANVTVSSNNSGSHGGGMYFAYCHWLTITDITASENSSTDSGGGMYINFCTNSTIMNVTASGNTASYDGGGMYIQLCNYSIFTDITASENSSTYSGGGMHIAHCYQSIFTDITASENSSTYRGGGGMYFEWCSWLTITDITASENSATYRGGGMCIDRSDNWTVTDVIVSSNNSGTNGGGMYSRYCDSWTVTNITVSSNNSGSHGGGMYIYEPRNWIITGGEVAYNTATISGDGIYFTGWGSNIVVSQSSQMPTRILGNGVHNDMDDYPGWTCLSPGNVDARNVYWGTTNEFQIRDMIFDFFDYMVKGIVCYDPFITPFDLWRIDYGLTTNDLPTGDKDNDGAPNDHEFGAGTDPTNQFSFFAVSNLQFDVNGDAVVCWYSVSNKTYSFSSSTNLTAGTWFPIAGIWDTISSNIAATPPLNYVTVNVSAVDGEFFRVGVE